MTIVYSSEFNRFFIVRQDAHHIMFGNHSGYATAREAENYIRSTFWE